MQFRDFKKLHKLPFKRSLDKSSINITFSKNKTFFLNPCLIDADSFLTKDIKLPKKLDFRSYVVILSFILSLQILFYDFRFYFAIKLAFLNPKKL
ncbi:hypothetical protein [Helicobacter pylori]|uniref:hypothetical protein n=1 Tax=Helicobacter pylori TaxID=210 RepID=UPI001037774B|nr:hypothetical protein [Helicobacter pylori]